MKMQAASPSSSTGASIASLVQVAPLIDPSIQKVMSRSWRSSAMKTSSPMPALVIALMAMPASRKIAIDVRPLRLAML